MPVRRTDHITGHTTTTIGGFTTISRPPAPPGSPPPADSPDHTLMTILWDDNLTERDHEIRRRQREKPDEGDDPGD